LPLQPEKSGFLAKESPRLTKAGPPRPITAHAHARTAALQLWTRGPVPAREHARQLFMRATGLARPLLRAGWLHPALHEEAGLRAARCSQGTATASYATRASVAACNRASLPRR
jgi:hypothetical protein